MRLHFAWLLLPLVSACAPGPTGNAPQALCQRESLNDPTVKQIAISQFGPYLMNPKVQFNYEQALHKAYDDCLLRHGIAVRGGVEAVQPGY
jgi:hypothetical protein